MDWVRDAVRLLRTPLICPEPTPLGFCVAIIMSPICMGPIPIWPAAVEAEVAVDVDVVADVDADVPVPKPPDIMLPAKNGTIYGLAKILPCTGFPPTSVPELAAPLRMFGATIGIAKGNGMIEVPRLGVPTFGVPIDVPVPREGVPRLWPTAFPPLSHPAAHTKPAHALFHREAFITEFLPILKFREVDRLRDRSHQSDS